MHRIIERLEALRAEQEREQDYWIAVHAIRNGLYLVPAERRAEFDPLGMNDDEEFIASHLTDKELNDARLAGEDDYWELAKYEDHEAYDQTQGFIAGVEAALQIIREEAA